MEVDGISVAAAETLEGLMLDTVVINGSGHLILTRKNGESIDAGLVRPAALNSWPVGSIYFSNRPENPAAIMGGGVWAVWGAGRVPTGVQVGDANFNTVEKTGGATTHTLTTDQMPAHNHTGTTSTDGNHQHTTMVSPLYKIATVTNTGSSYVSHYWTTEPTSFAGAHNHSLNINNAGGGASHPILQPYITCYMWKRLPDVGP